MALVQILHQYLSRSVFNDTTRAAFQASFKVPDDEPRDIRTRLIDRSIFVQYSRFNALTSKGDNTMCHCPV